MAVDEDMIGFEMVVTKVGGETKAWIRPGRTRITTRRTKESLWISVFWQKLGIIQRNLR